MLAEDLGNVVTRVVVVHHRVPHVGNGLTVGFVLDVVNQRERHVLDIEERDGDDSTRVSMCSMEVKGGVESITLCSPACSNQADYPVPPARSSRPWR